MADERVEPESLTKSEQLALVQQYLHLEGANEHLRTRTPDWFGPVLFGGFVVAQAIAAVMRHAPDESRLHSLHAYFLRPVSASAAVDFHVEAIRDGRSFATRSLRAEQDAKSVLTMLASFTADVEADDYDLGGIDDGVPGPESAELGDGPPPFETAWVGATEPLPDGTMVSTHRHWFRVPVAMPDDPVLHTALLGFATDWSGTGGRPLRLDGDTTGMLSLDHAIWFHRPPRVDDWLLADFHSLVNAGGRSMLRGVLRDRDGRAIASMAQEMLLR